MSRCEPLFSSVNTYSDDVQHFVLGDESIFIRVVETKRPIELIFQFAF